MISDISDIDMINMISDDTIKISKCIFYQFQNWVMSCSQSNKNGIFSGVYSNSCGCFLKFIFGPGVLACATRGGGRSEAGHCFHLLFSSSSFFFLLFSPPSTFHPLRGISRASKFVSPNILA